MNARFKHVLTGLIALLLVISFSSVPQTASAQGGPAFSQQELDQMLAPIALYPDSLLSQILMAATYPLEVVEADRWSRSNSGLKGDDAVRAADQYHWDPSVQSLVAFPNVLDMMDDKLDWTQRLGDAFLDQQTQVMETVQALRRRADAAGNLRSNDEVRIDQEGQYYGIDYANPQDVYVPYYDPNYIYGSWWWPTYPPVYWGPWPGYSVRAGFGFAWGIGIRVSSGFFFGAFDWGRRRVNVVNVNNYYYQHSAGARDRGPGAWQHDPDHRRGVPYRAASVRQQFGRASSSPETQRDYRGHASTAPERRDGSDIRPQERISQPAPGASPDTRSAPGRMNAPGESRAPAAPNRPNAPAVASRPQAEPRPHAFEGVSQGAQVRNYSERGRASAQSPTPSAAPAARPAQSAPAPRAAGNAPPGRGNERR